MRRTALLDRALQCTNEDREGGALGYAYFHEALVECFYGFDFYFYFRSRERMAKERPIKGATKGFTNEYGWHRQVGFWQWLELMS
jgi:hypothetical protein